MSLRSNRKAIVGSLSLLFTGFLAMQAAKRQRMLTIPYYGGDPGAMRYSTLTQITAANVSKLKEVWRYDLGGAATIENQPIVVNGIIYGMGVDDNLCSRCRDRQDQMGKHTAAGSRPQPARRNILDRRQGAPPHRDSRQYYGCVECRHRQTHPGIRQRGRGGSQRATARTGFGKQGRHEQSRR